MIDEYTFFLVHVLKAKDPYRVRCMPKIHKFTNSLTDITAGRPVIAAPHSSKRRICMTPMHAQLQ